MSSPSKRPGRVVVITGASGAGKTTLARRAVEAVPSLRYSVSATTRAPRPGEIDGVHYYFLTTEAFVEALGAGRFLEHTSFAGNYYGTLHGELDRITAAGNSAVVIAEPIGARAIESTRPEAVTINIVAPSLAVLADRLRERGTNSELEIAERLRRHTDLAPLTDAFDYEILNDDLSDAEDTLVALLSRILPTSIAVDPPVVALSAAVLRAIEVSRVSQEAADAGIPLGLIKTALDADRLQMLQGVQGSRVVAEWELSASWRALTGAHRFVRLRTDPAGKVWALVGTSRARF